MAVTMRSCIVQTSRRRAHAARLLATILLAWPMSSGAIERRPGEPDLALRGSQRGDSIDRGFLPRRQELRRARERVTVYWDRRRGSPRRGWIAEDTIFVAEAIGPGAACDTSWARLRRGGYVCLDGTQHAEASGPRLPAAHPGRPLPFTYAARAGDPAFSYAFEGLVRDETGREMLVRPGGRAVEASRYEVHDGSAFRGRDLRLNPVDDGMVPAWAFVEDAPVHPLPSAASVPVGHLRKHTAIAVVAEPADEDGHWFRIPDALGPGRPGFVDDRGVRRWVPAPPLSDVERQEIWLDIDLEQQVLAVWRGEAVIYVTLVSTGIPSRATPTGIYSIRDKRAWSSMGNRPTSEDRYFVEKVPWTMYFRDYYAIHGAYWHDVFGQARSHGCINLAPHDAAFVYRVVSPRSEPGFMWTVASERAPGSTVRIRKGARAPRDFRA
jgi:lipoprotein-anchoring transpeptidase ErfK/SrfK